MKTGTKRFLSLIVLAVMILSLSGIETALAASDAIKLSKKSTVSVAANLYSRASGDINLEGAYLSFQSNQWVEYDVEAPEEGEYDVLMTVGSPTDKTLTVTANGGTPISTGFSSTGGYFKEVEYSVATVKLAAGVNTIRITNVIGSYYYKKVGFSPVKKAGDGSGFAKSSGAYRTAELPTIIEAEDFDLGAGGSKSADGKNNGKPYRTEGIDILENKDKDGYYIALATGEYVKYTFTVREDSAYTMYASGAAQMIDLYFDDCAVPVVAQILRDEENPETELMSIFLEEGEHTVKFEVSSGTAEIDYIRFASAKGEYITVADIENTAMADEEQEENKEEVKNPVYKNLYVSADGQDNGDGTKESPFKTIKRAKEETAEISENMTGDIVVNIAPGYYQLTETEVFDETHSGKNGFNVIYKGENKFQPPVISGGKKVEGWEQVSDIMWRAPIETESSIRNLYVNGLPAIRARSKYAYLYLENYDAEGNETEQDGFKASAINFPVDIVGQKGLELVWNAEWTAQRTLVEDVALEGDKVVFTMQQPYWENRNTSTKMNSGAKFYIENAYCLLDEPGEFYYNKEEGYIYYYPYAEEDMKTADTMIGELEGLVKIEGSDLENKAENITFDNLDFRYGAWEEVSSSGLIAVQADWLKTFEGKSKMVPAQIALNRAKNINFTNSRFSCLGSGAISMVDAVSDSSVIGNLFKDVSGTGVLIGTPNHKIVPEGMEMCENIRVENNVMRRVACEYHSSVGVIVFFERNIDIIHNTFIDSTYTQVSAGWGWGDDSKTCGEITIAYNRFEDGMNTLRDGAHLYTLGANPGSSINNNYFLKSGTGAAGYGGVYTDSGSAYFKINNNVFEETPKLWFVGLYNTHDNTANNNFTEYEQNQEMRVKSNTISNTTVVKDKNWPDEAKTIIAEAGVEARYSNLLNLAKAPEWRRSNTQTIPKGIYQSSDSWLEAEDFINGGQNVGYYKIEEKINNNGYRSDGVALMDSPSGNGYVIHQCFDGEWQKYDFKVNESGEYDLYIKAAHNYKETDLQPGLAIEIDGAMVIEEVIIPSTKSWSKITPMKIGTVNLTAGNHVLKSTFLNNGFYLDAFKFVPAGEEADKSAMNDPAYDEGKIVYQWEYEQDNTVEEKTWFTDIAGHWAESDIIKMAELGLVNGYSEEIFAPDDNVTLYQAIWLAMRVMDFEYDEASWQEKAVEYKIFENPYVADRAINREEFINIIMNAQMSKTGAYNLTYSMNAFGDTASIAPEYLVPVLGAKSLGIIQGDEYGNFNPKKLLSRAETVTVLSNILN